MPYSETGFTMRSGMTLRAQQEAGFTPEVITSLGFPRSKAVTDFPSNQELDGVVHHHLDAGADVDVAALPPDVGLTINAQMAAEIADEFQPRLVQSGTGYRGFETALLGIAVAERHQVPFVYEVRGFQEQTWTGNIARSERGEYFHRRLAQENRCMHRAERVITIADAMATEIVERGISADKVAVVPNAVDVERFSPRPKREDLLRRYGLENRFILGYISNLGAREGIDQLVRAMGILRSRHSEAVCLIIGDGLQRPLLDQLIADLDLQRHVILPGHVPNDQIEDHYALIDLFVVPRIEDRAARLVTPLKPLEAMAMGLPVIASSLPALEELVKPHERGLVFEPADPAAIADTADMLIQDSGLRAKLADGGHDWVRQHRTLESNVLRYGEILGPLF